MKTYVVWREDEEREDGRKIMADYPEQAACKWAEKDDALSADYAIVGGASTLVFVAPEDSSSEPELFEVRGEAVPLYYARNVMPNVQIEARRASAASPSNAGLGSAERE